MKRRLISKLVAISLSTALLAGCGATDTTVSSVAKQNNISEEEVPVTENADTSLTDSYTWFWSAGQPTSSVYTFSVACSSVIMDALPNVNITLLESGGMSDNLANIQSGQAQIAQGSEPDLYDAENGLGIYADGDYSEARLLCLAAPMVYVPFVTDESGITEYSGLAGVDFCPGAVGSSTCTLAYTLFDDIFEYHPNWYPGSASESVEAVKDKRSQGLWRCVGTKTMDSSVSDAETSVSMHALSISEEEKAKVLEHFPYYKFLTIDGSIYGQEDFTAISLYLGLMLRKDTPNQIVYAMCDALFNNQEQVWTQYATSDGYDFAEVTATQSVTLLHSGVVQWLLDHGYEVDESQIPEEYEPFTYAGN